MLYTMHDLTISRAIHAQAWDCTISQAGLRAWCM